MMLQLQLTKCYSVLSQSQYLPAHLQSSSETTYLPDNQGLHNVS